MALAQAPVEAARAGARPHQIATPIRPSRTPPPRTRPAPPRIGTRATSRRIAQPTRNAATQTVRGRSSDRPRIQALAA